MHARLVDGINSIRLCALSTSRQDDRALDGQNLIPIGTFLTSGGDRPDMDADIDEACRPPQLPFKFLKIVLDGPTSSRDDVAIIHHV